MTFWGWATVGAGLAVAASAAEPVTLGVDANYVLGMEREGRVWKWAGRPADLFEGIARQGVSGFRVRLWTGDTGPNGKHEATEIVRRARAAGLDPYLVLFLSDDWADLMKQPAPAAWKGLGVEERAEQARIYARDSVEHFRREGLRSHLYEIGNEIDMGSVACIPERTPKRIRLPSVAPSGRMRHALSWRPSRECGRPIPTPDFCCISRTGGTLPSARRFFIS